MIETRGIFHQKMPEKIFLRFDSPYCKLLLCICACPTLHKAKVAGKKLSFRGKGPCGSVLSTVFMSSFFTMSKLLLKIGL